MYNLLKSSDIVYGTIPFFQCEFSDFKPFLLLALIIMSPSKYVSPNSSGFVPSSGCHRATLLPIDDNKHIDQKILIIIIIILAKHLERHNKICQYLHWNICREYKMDGLPKEWYQFRLRQRVHAQFCMVNKPRTVPANKPDIILRGIMRKNGVS